MNQRRRVLAVCAALVAVVALAACSHDTGASRPRRGGILRLGLARPASLDPAQARSQEELLLARQLFVTVTTHDPVTVAPRPGLASSWHASADQTQWDFTLRRDAVFADGDRITSADVRFSLQRVARRSTNSPAADLLAPVTGFGPFAAGQAQDLAGITTPSPEVVHIALDRPLSTLPAVLSSPVFGIVSRAAVAAPDFAARPAGSGAFTASARLGDQLQLRRTARSGAYLDGIDVTFFENTAASYRAFQAGRLDWSRVPPEAVDGAAGRYGATQFRPYWAELFYGFNLKSPALSDIALREAVVHAIDRRAIVASVYKNTVDPLDGVIVRGMPGHQADPCGPRCGYDVAKAKALLARLYPPPATPPQIPIDYDDDPTQQAVAKVIQADLAAVGIPAVLQPKPVADYPAFAVSGRQQLFRLGWVAAYPSAEALLSPLFETGQADNLTGLAAPEVDRALAAARRTPDPARQVADYQAAERAVMAQLPVIPIAQFNLPAVVAAPVRGLLTSVTGTFDGTAVWLASGPSH